jgi:hypothetical protein
MRTDRVAGSALVLLGLLVLWESRALPFGSLTSPGPAFAPVALALVLAAFGAAIALGGGASLPLRDLGWGEAGHALAVVVACAFGAFALERLGYRVTMAVLVFFLLRAVERRGTLFAAGFAVGLALITFYVFDTVLRVRLPRGPFGI